MWAVEDRTETGWDMARWGLGVGCDLRARRWRRARDVVDVGMGVGMGSVVWRTVWGEDERGLAWSCGYGAESTSGLVGLL